MDLQASFLSANITFLLAKYRTARGYAEVMLDLYTRWSQNTLPHNRFFHISKGNTALTNREYDAVSQIWCRITIMVLYYKYNAVSQIWCRTTIMVPYHN